MDLHRVGKTADWDRVAPRDRNRWQRWAWQTHGIVTPGNVLSTVGLGLVLWGLVRLIDGDLLAGLLGLWLGRSADILDGVVAHYTGTKSPLGELVDTAFDKVTTLLTLIVLVVCNLLPALLAILLAVQSGVTILVSLLAQLKGIRLHPSRDGKLAMIGYWLLLLGFVAAHLVQVYGYSTTGSVLAWFGYSLAVITLALWLRSTAAYWQQVRVAGAKS